MPLPHRRWARREPHPGRRETRRTGRPPNKDGFGTATTQESKVWHTLSNGELTEVYYPDLGTPSVRDLQFIVSDGSTFAERETDATDHVTELADGKSLTYRQVNTAKLGRYRITKTYAEDPARNALLVDVRFESLTGKALSLYALYDPALANDGSDDTGSTSGAALLASRQRQPGRERADRLARLHRHLERLPGHAATAGPTCATTSRMDGTYADAPSGNVVQTGKTALTGLPGSQNLDAGAGLRRHDRRRRRRGHRRRSPAASTPSPPPTPTAGTATSAGLKPGAGERRGLRPDLRRLGHGAGRARGQDLPRRLRRLADDAVGCGAPGWRTRPAPTTWCGRATSTRSPPR